MAAPMRKTYAQIVTLLNRKSLIFSNDTNAYACLGCKRLGWTDILSCVKPLVSLHGVKSELLTQSRTNGPGGKCCWVWKTSNRCRTDCLGLDRGVLGDTKMSLTVINCKRTISSDTKQDAAADNSRNETSPNDPDLPETDPEVKENIFTIPNILTMSRIVLTPVIGYLVVQESFTIALGLFAYAGITDLLDGYVARNFKNQMSAFGTALDPLADKILITVLTITLATANLLPVPLAALIVIRDIGLIANGFVIRYVSLPPPITLKRYFDATNPTAKVLPSLLSKWNTTFQLALVCFTLAAPVFHFVDHIALQGLWYLTGATTAWSAIDYMWNRKTYIQYLKNKKNDDGA